MSILYTIGHSNHTLEAFRSLLDQHRIDLLIDVRSAPYSGYSPHFNRSSLEATLKAGYLYRGDVLGGRPTDPALYHAAPDDALKREDYLTQVDYKAVMQTGLYRTAIDELMQIVNRQTPGSQVALMCSEANPLECHRHHLIARSLLDPAVRFVSDNIMVVHILRDGDLMQPEADSFIAPPRQMNLF